MPPVAVFDFQILCRHNLQLWSTLIFLIIDRPLNRFGIRVAPPPLPSLVFKPKHKLVIFAYQQSKARFLKHVRKPRGVSDRCYISRESTGPQRSQRLCHHGYGPRRVRTVDVQSPPRARPVRGAPASRESGIDRWWDRRDRFPAVPTTRVSHPGSEVHRALADAFGRRRRRRRNLDIHGHLRRSVQTFFFFALCAFGGKKWAFVCLQGMRDTPPWSTLLGRFPP